MKSALLTTILTLALASLLLCADERQLITSADELPVRSYTVGAAPSALLDDDEALLALAHQLERDLLDDLQHYRFEDRSETRRYYQTLAFIAMLDGRDDQALERFDAARDYEDNPASRLTLGLAPMAAIAARQVEADQAEAEFRNRFDELLSGLPLEVVEPELRSLRSNAAFLTDGFLRGRVQARLDIAAADLDLSSRRARDLIQARALLELTPYSSIISEQINQHLAEWTTEVADIWAERQVNLSDEDGLNPVVVAVWDTGLDPEVFSGRLFVDPDSPADAPVHGLAFDMDFHPTSEMLQVLEDMPEEMPDCHFKAISDQRAGLDTPEARELQRRLATIEPDRVRDTLKAMGDCLGHFHGTHVAGIAAEGNPAVRILNLRQKFDTRIPPAPLSETRRERIREAWRQMSDYIQRHGVRVANMSWGFGPGGIEQVLEMTGVGDSAEERRALAREYFDEAYQALRQYLASAPDVLFVAAAGNAAADNRFLEQIPASIELPNLLTVSAVDQAGREAPFTSYGRVDLYANGVDVESYVPGGERMPASGTSMAAPQVANLAAKLLALEPSLTTAELRQLILDGADEQIVGDGRSIRLLNPARSLQLLRDASDS